MFCVGAYNTLRICDKMGYSYAVAKPSTGSISDISWSPDGSMFVAAGGRGVICKGRVVDMYLYS